tara:strand:- start:1583 stop:1813 length:231 start_codon:yes stop_codon:yes gene_type:complete
MMHFNYRVMRKHEGENKYSYGIYEVFYENGSIISWTETTVDAIAETFDDLRAGIKYLEEALAHPVLDYATGKEIEA